MRKPVIRFHRFLKPETFNPMQAIAFVNSKHFRILLRHGLLAPTGT